VFPSRRLTNSVTALTETLSMTSNDTSCQVLHVSIVIDNTTIFVNVFHLKHHFLLPLLLLLPVLQLSVPVYTTSQTEQLASQSVISQQSTLHGAVNRGSEQRTSRFWKQTASKHALAICALLVNCVRPQIVLPTKAFQTPLVNIHYVQAYSRRHGSPQSTFTMFKL